MPSQQLYHFRPAPCYSLIDESQQVCPKERGERQAGRDVFSLPDKYWCVEPADQPASVGRGNDGRSREGPQPQLSVWSAVARNITKSHCSLGSSLDSLSVQPWSVSLRISNCCCSLLLLLEDFDKLLLICCNKPIRLFIKRPQHSTAVNT